MRIVCLSDTHDMHSQIEVPDGDLLLHAGDATMRGTLEQIEAFDWWLAARPHRHKVVIAGNHDWGFQRTPAKARSLIRHARYLEDDEVTIGGLRIWGSPWQPWFHDWAFNLQRGTEIAAKWALIPDGIDVLITHGPPFGILDRTDNHEDVGCVDLLAAAHPAEAAFVRPHPRGARHARARWHPLRERLQLLAALSAGAAADRRRSLTQCPRSSG
jgi:predicted phosphodiesterase